MPGRRGLRSVEPEDQIGMDERVVTDDDLAAALERRWRLDGDRKEHAAAFKRADEEAKELIAKHPIDAGGGNPGRSVRHPEVSPWRGRRRRLHPGRQVAAHDRALG